MMLKNITCSHRALMYVAVAAVVLAVMEYTDKSSIPRASDACMIEQAKISAYLREENKISLYAIMTVLTVIALDYSVVVLSPVFKNAYKEYKAQK
jgi:hypothetical protein